jgi:hypothetical protein
MISKVEGSHRKTTLDKTWTKYSETPRPYMAWSNFPLKKNTMAEPGIEPGPLDQ